jgi:hypothetical protein
LRVFLEAAEKCRKAGSASDGYDPQGAVQIEGIQKVSLSFSSGSHRPVKIRLPSATYRNPGMYRNLFLEFIVDLDRLQVFGVKHGAASKAPHIINAVTAIKELCTRVRAGGHVTSASLPISFILDKCFLLSRRVNTGYGKVCANGGIPEGVYPHIIVSPLPTPGG